MVVIDRLRRFGMEGKYRITVSFQGVALEGHSIDVKELAPSMLALGQLFDEANSFLNGEKVTTNTKVIATSPGSFDISFILNQTFLESAKGLFATSIFSASQIAQFLFFDVEYSLSLSGLLKWLKGDKPKKVEEVKGDETRLNIENSNGVQIYIDKRVFNMSGNASIVDSFKKSIKPVTAVGIEEIEFRGDNQLSTIYKSEYSYYETDTEDDIVTENIVDMILNIESPNFKEGNQWILNDGEKSRYYPIVDEEFNKLVELREPFSKYDQLKCKVKIIQKQDSVTGAIKTKHVIIKAEHIKIPADQLKMSFLKSGDDDEQN